MFQRPGDPRRAARLSISLLFWVTFWPAAPLAGGRGAGGVAAAARAGARFLLAWLVPCWIVFELVMTKLPHYVLPLYPAIAILIAGVLDRGGSRAAHAGCGPALPVGSFSPV